VQRRPDEASPGVGSYDPTYAAFRDLMSFRIREVLLVSSLYDSYILEVDGQLAEGLDAEYHALNLSSSPRITRASRAEEALERLSAQAFDLVITMPRVGGMDVVSFGEEVHCRHPDLPLVLLADNEQEAARVKEQDARGFIDRIFVWRGDVALFLAIIKYVEDRRNIEHDIAIAGVRAIILIENSPRFYSSYLPLLYTELMEQTSALMVEGVDVRQRLRRIKARSKILLAETFEEGWDLYRRHRSHVLGVITDARFPRAGKSDPEAGLEFVRRVKTEDPDMPALVQSSDGGLSAKAAALGAAFLNKRTPRLLDDIRRFLKTDLGFGDFIFTIPGQGEVARARDLASMAQVLRDVPEESLRYHASRNHFSNWCLARTEFALAENLRPRRVTESSRMEDVRAYLIQAFNDLRSATRRGVVAEFSRIDFDGSPGVARIGLGSMGGKGRGLGFIHSFLSSMADQDFAVDIFVPPAAVIGTDVFDSFMEENRLSELALSEASDDDIARAFLDAPLPIDLIHDLRAFVDRFQHPLAVRSSSLLEDSHDQPLAGIYRTIMLPNDDPDPRFRLEQICSAVRLVYASTYSANAKAYLHHTPHRMEEEKMAVVLQKIVGRRHDRWFYPDLAGIARSYNYYPVLDLKPEEGMAMVALGFGRTVVEGGRAVRFCPGAPTALPQFSSTADILRNAQREFYALELGSRGSGWSTADEDRLVRLDLDTAEEHSTLGAVASVYSPDNDAVYDGLSRPGIRLVTFAPILKTRTFPLAQILRRLLQIGEEAMGCPVEIEFAANLAGPRTRPEFGVVQIRPMVVKVGEGSCDGALSEINEDRVLCCSHQALGHARVQNIHDVVYVRPSGFDRARTQTIAEEVGAVNTRLVREGRPYLLIGPGRWGTSDRWLGIPVEWRQINGARAIIETDLDDVPVMPSEGTHFFQNLTCFGIGYLTVHRGSGGGSVDYAWLNRQPALEESELLRHVRLSTPLDLRIDGRSRRGVVLKDAAGSSLTA